MIFQFFNTWFTFQRRNLQMELEKAQKKSSQNYKTKTDQVSSMGGGQVKENFRQ